MPSREEVLRRLARNAAELKRFSQLDLYEPYLKQREFHNLGATHDERALIAGNQVGKTHAGSAEDAIHATGRYPSWWQGKRFKTPVKIWVCGLSGEKVRNNMQSMLYGAWDRPDEFGTGFLPMEAIIGRPTLSRGVTGYYDTGSVRWTSPDGRLDESAVSTITFKAYTEGQLAFASDTLHVIHGDEEDKTKEFAGIYTEMRTRVQVMKGITYMTLTPLLGWTEFITKFLKEPTSKKIAVNMGIYDALVGHDREHPHLGHYESKARADEIIAGFPPHLRNAKAYGEPALGEGKVFLTPDAEYMIERPGYVPREWAKLGALDFGGAGSGSHPFAYVLIAWDQDNDVIYLLHALKMQGMTRLQHIPRIRELAANVPVAWPHDGNEAREGQGATVTLAEQYKNPMPGMPGLLMLPTHATWPAGGFSTGAAVEELDDRMQTGRFKAVDDLADFWHEVRQYHRDDGKLVKVNDDILSALYKALMMKRYAKMIELGNDPLNRRRPRPFSVPDIDPFSGDAIDNRFRM